MSSGTLRQQAYQQIRQWLISGELAAGSQLSEPSLAKLLGMSRTPVREAIQQLELEGLVQQVPRYGTIVRTPQRQELIELYEVRESLESYAAAKAARQISPADLILLERHCEQMRHVGRELRAAESDCLDDNGLQRFLAVDLAFHMVLIRAAGNRRIMKIVSDTRALGRIFCYRRQEHDLRIVARAYRFHRRILRAICRQDAEAARACMAEHIRVSQQQAIQHFDQRRAASDAAELSPLGWPEELMQEFGDIDRQT